MKKTTLLYGNLNTKRVSNSSGAAITLPPFVQEDFNRIKLRLLDVVEDEIQEVRPYVRSLKASLTRLMAPPEFGTFRLKIDTGGTPGSKLQYNHEETALAQSIGALSGIGDYGPVLDVQQTSDSTWLIYFDFDGAVPLKAAENHLEPICDIRVRAYQQGDIWVHELRLIQLPISFASTFDRILGDMPTPRRIVAGATAVEGLVEIKRNEVQAYTIDPALRATYRIKIDNHATVFLSTTDTLDVIQSAMDNIGIAGGSFVVTNPNPGDIYIEFQGDLFSGIPQDMMVIEIGEYQPGDIEFILDLDNAETDAVLRNDDQVQMYFEVKLFLGEDGEEEPLPPAEPLLVFREVVTIARSATYDEQDTQAHIEWTKPTNPTDFMRFTPDQIIVGTHSYSLTIGNGTLKSFTIVHNLNSALGHITIRESIDGGRILTQNAEFKTSLDNANQFTIAFPASGTAPTSGQYTVLFSAAGPEETFLAHTHTISQIVGDTEGAETLRQELDDLKGRIGTLEDFIPTAGGGITNAQNASGASMIINLGDHEEIMFFKATATNKAPVFSDAGLDATVFPRRAPYLLPAINTTTIVDPLPDPLPDLAVGLWKTGAARLIPGGGGIRSSQVENDTFVASDGRMFYPVNKQPSKDTYHPIAFERVLWNIFLNDQQFSVNSKLDLKFAVSLQLINADKQAQWVLIIEKAALTTASTPGTPGANVTAVVWDTATPIIAQPLIITPQMITHTFGVALARGASTISLDKMLYGKYTGANSLAPASANFGLRARLAEMDTEDAKPGVGWLGYKLSGVSGPSQAIITS